MWGRGAPIEGFVNLAIYVRRFFSFRVFCVTTLDDGGYPVRRDPPFGSVFLLVEKGTTWLDACLVVRLEVLTLKRSTYERRARGATTRRRVFWRCFSAMLLWCGKLLRGDVCG